MGHDRLQDLDLFFLARINPEGMSQLYASWQPSNAGASMDNYDEEEEGEDDI